MRVQRLTRCDSELLHTIDALLMWKVTLERYMLLRGEGFGDVPHACAKLIDFAIKLSYISQWKHASTGFYSLNLVIF
jgi:hypothetical protein